MVACILTGASIHLRIMGAYIFTGGKRTLDFLQKIRLLL